MKHTTIIISALFLATMATGCLLDLRPSNNETQNNQTQNNQNQNNQNWEVKDANLKATFVSGNLGSYHDCPDKGVRPGQSSSEPSNDSPANKAAPGFAPCPEPEEGADVGEDYCGGPLNCSDAQLTLRLNNDGAIAGRNIRIKEILLLDDNKMVKATFPILETFDAMTNETFDGNLEAGKTLNIRVDFTGPKSVSEFLDDGAQGNDARFGSDRGARLRIIIESDTHEKIEIDTKEVHPIGLVVT